jgi:hypothetical protein
MMVPRAGLEPATSGDIARNSPLFSKKEIGIIVKTMNF